MNAANTLNNTSLFADYDRMVTLALLRLEDALVDCQDTKVSESVRGILNDADALTDALFAYWSQIEGEIAERKASALGRVYRWVTEIVEQLEEAFAHNQDMDASFKLLCSYSNLFVRGIIEPGLKTMEQEAEENGDEWNRIISIKERVGLLDWSVTCAASED